jgi:hypothetical protein
MMLKEYQYRKAATLEIERLLRIKLVGNKTVSQYSSVYVGSIPP